jgi:hypothetical protein
MPTRRTDTGHRARRTPRRKTLAWLSGGSLTIRGMYRITRSSG